MAGANQVDLCGIRSAEVARCLVDSLILLCREADALAIAKEAASVDADPGNLLLLANVAAAIGNTGQARKIYRKVADGQILRIEAWPWRRKRRWLDNLPISPRRELERGETLALLGRIRNKPRKKVVGGHCLRMTTITSMILMALASQSACIFPPLSQRGAKGPIDWQAGSFVLKMRSNGKDVSILLDSGHPSSFWTTTSPPPTEPLTFGGVSIGSVRFGQTTLPGVDGVICMDALSRWAIGVDFLANTLTIWPSGTFKESAEKWVASDTTYGPNPLMMVRSVSIELIRGLPHVSVTNQGQASKPILLLETDCSVIHGHTIGGVPMPPGLCSLEPGVEIGNDPIPWLQRILIPQMSEQDYFEAGVLSLENFGSPRVLVDFPARRLYYQKAPPAFRSSFLLSRIEQLPLTFSPGRVKFGGPMAGLFPEASELIGSDLVQIADVSASELADQVLNPSPKSAEFLTHFSARLTKGYTIVYRKDGKERTFVMDP